MEKKKDANEIKKILIQKIPHLADGTLLFEPVEAEEMHRGSVQMMKKNEGKILSDIQEELKEEAKKVKEREMEDKRKYMEEKTPIIGIIGAKEALNQQITLRYLGSKEEKIVSIEELIDEINNKIKQKI